MKQQLSVKILTTLWIAGTIFFGIPWLSLAQDSSPALPSTGLKTTDELLDEVCSFLKEQKSFTVEIDINYDNVLTTGEKVQYSAYQQVWLNKPAQFRSDYLGDERHTQFYYDGKSFSLYNPDLNFYSTKEAPPTMDEVVDNIDEKYGITIPLSNLFVSDPCAAVESDLQKSLFIGNDLVNREETYHILFIGEERDFQIWVSKGEEPTLKKLLITYKNLPGSPQYTAVFSNWNFNPSIPTDTFTFTPPEDAVPIEFLPPEEYLPPELPEEPETSSQ